VPEISVQHVARIEGHGNISVTLDGEGVREVRLDVVEPARYFESMVRGRPYHEAPLITSRICGICSPNHTLTSIKALEATLGIRVSKRTEVMRKLLVYGSYLQNHATHLYIFAAPDFVGQPSVFPLAASHPAVVERALRVKKLGNELTTLVGGRTVHPVTAVVGGFTSEPDLGKLKAFRELLVAAVEDAVLTTELFDSFEVPQMETAGDMLALVSDDDYAIYDGDIGSLIGGWRRPVSEYREVLVEQVVEHSNAKHSTVDGRTFMVGALPRINLSSARLMPRAAETLGKLGVKAPSRNPFLNNVCQAVELVDAAERCVTYIDQLLEMGGSTEPVRFDLVAGSGAAATEAPRGTLYHSVELDEDGRVAHYDVITPTAQNLANLEADMRALAPQLVGKDKGEATLLMEMLVRAYDPCLSCSVH
jgi:sulfhydrogenase subunit alpha